MQVAIRRVDFSLRIIARFSGKIRHAADVDREPVFQYPSIEAT